MTEVCSNSSPGPVSGMIYFRLSYSRVSNIYLFSFPCMEYGYKPDIKDQQLQLSL